CLLDHVSAVVVTSHFLVAATEALGVPRGRIHVIPAGVETTFCTPSEVPTDPKVLFVGRFVEKKGLDVLHAAWTEVAARMPDAHLHVLGFGPLESLARSGGNGITVTRAVPTHRADQVRHAIRS